MYSSLINFDAPRLEDVSGAPPDITAKRTWFFRRNLILLNMVFAVKLITSTQRSVVFSLIFYAGCREYL